MNNGLNDMHKAEGRHCMSKSCSRVSVRHCLQQYVDREHGKKPKKLSTGMLVFPSFRVAFDQASSSWFILSGGALQDGSASSDVLAISDGLSLAVEARTDVEGHRHIFHLLASFLLFHVCLCCILCFICRCS